MIIWTAANTVIPWEMGKRQSMGYNLRKNSLQPKKGPKYIRQKPRRITKEAMQNEDEEDNTGCETRKVGEG